MKINILFFGATADLTGFRRIERTVHSPISADDVLKQLRDEYPNFKDHKLLFAVNEEYAALDFKLKDGDELAVFTAVSGG
jgi:molybdopterin converting factor small subunit